jgi:hypothetical protein
MSLWRGLLPLCPIPPFMIFSFSRLFNGAINYCRIKIFFGTSYAHTVRLTDTGVNQS